jgi:hypothetical protein
VFVVFVQRLPFHCLPQSKRPPAPSRTLQERGRTKLWYQLSSAIPAIILAHAYPRLDVEVSRKMNHLLKARKST